MDEMSAVLIGGVQMLPCRINPAFSVGENFSPDTAGHMALISMQTAASPRQSEPLFTHAF
jgi:hypothetical protein